MNCMAARYIFSCFNCFASILATSEPVFYIASVGAVFALPIPVDGECLVAAGTFHLSYASMVHLVPMAVPPDHPAGIGAELLLLPFVVLLNRLTALQAVMDLFRFRLLGG